MCVLKEKRCLILSALLVAFVAVGDALGDIASIYIHADGYEMPYRLFEAPVDNQPLVVALHGWGEKGNDNELQLRFFGGLINEAESRGVNLLAPQVPVGGHWLGYERGVLDALVSDIIDIYAIDESRMYLTGYSMGGFGTYEVSREYPRYAAMMPMSSERSAATAHLYTTPTWAFVGENEMPPDALEIRDPMIAFYEAQVAAGIESYLTIVPGQAHGGWDVYYSDQHPDFSMAEVYDWMFAHSVVPEPSSVVLATLSLLSLALYGWRRKR